MMKLKRQLHSLLHRRASILIVVLWVMIGIAAVTLYYSDDMNLEYRASDNYVQAAQARQTVDGMRRYLLDFFTTWNKDNKGILPVVETDYVADAIQVGKGKAWLIGRAPEKNKHGKELHFELVDEASKININTASLATLKLIPNMTDSLAARIIDWRDKNDTSTENGAETLTYQLGTPSYKCKNADLETLEELRLVIGVDDNMDLLYKEDTNNNGVLDDNENDGDTNWPADNGDGKIDFGVMEYLTVYSREPNVAADGTKRINVTSTTLEIKPKLTTLLTDKISSSRAAAIMSKVGNARNVTSLLDFYVRSGMTAEEFAKVDTYLAISDKDYETGLVNVNTASADVLTCVTGLDSSTADTIVSTRDGLTTDKMKTIAWVASILTSDQITKAGKYLTAHSYVYTADIAAVGEYGRGFQRESMVIDTSSNTPQIIYHRDRTRMGWPLGKEIRETLDTEVGETKK
ncbi:TPA: hypothetical protein DDW35_06115 [Candidatus Sumerlaeota bacterium]|jgi:DNA uptake protein ComE-like DNA-binding protein|nr:hypothetical protein [Candidatus Sumerlaeota bacterium]